MCLLHAGAWRRSRLFAFAVMPVLELRSHGPESKKKSLMQMRGLLTFTHPDATNSSLRSRNAGTRLCSHCVRKLWARYMYLGGSPSPTFFKRHTAIPLNNKSEFTHKMDSSNKNRPSGGGGHISNELSESSRDTPKHNEAKNDAGVSSSYAISTRGETTDLRETLALRSLPEGSARTGESKAFDGDRADQEEKSEQDQSALGEDGGPSGYKSMSDEPEHGTATGTDKNGTKGEPKAMKEYSAEARTYHAYYDEVNWAPRPFALIICY